MYQNKNFKRFEVNYQNESLVFFYPLDVSVVSLDINSKCRINFSEGSWFDLHARKFHNKGGNILFLQNSEEYCFDLSTTAHDAQQQWKKNGSIDRVY